MDIKEIKVLLKLIEQSQIDEIEIEEEGKKIRISKNLPGNKPLEQSQHFIMPPAATAAIAAQPAPTAPVDSDASISGEKKYNGNTIEVKAPMVGTFYRAPAPDAPPYAEIGDEVKAGQTLCIIEAMKLMNEIESDYNGKIVNILVENAEPVEFGKVLFIIEKR